jgi:hypothetical protein
VLDVEGRILDGRNRYAACEKAGVKPAFVNYAGKDPHGYALAVNKHRRHMRPSALQLITEEVRRLMVGKQSHITQTKRKAIAIMRRSCSDSLLTASQVDGVFGSDNRCRGRKCGRNVGFWVILWACRMSKWKSRNNML